MSTSTLIFPAAQQAQIIRANQRDLYHVSSLKVQVESILRSWFGTRWLTRWDKELDLFVKLCYYGLTTGTATQTLGEEYTGIWQYSPATQTVPPSNFIRTTLIILSLVPSYAIGRLGQNAALNSRHPNLSNWLKRLPSTLDVLTEINLAIFYLRGNYYDLVKRVMGVHHISSIPEDPHTRPPSYSLLGIMIGVRLIHRLISYLNAERAQQSGKERLNTPALHDSYLDDRRVSLLLTVQDPEGEPAKPAEQDERTALDVTAISAELRASRNCTLCLEERTDSCATECGHLFCWNCIVGWGREKAECPLCRQSLILDRLLPIYNL
ncbi:hypothetical protein BYT27DRAFT_7189729 [Phlegmacium glaucopus]|nr:hypothetical protein BYT27DRAFT_7189729 [Phlegmacium glaucopus]